MQCKLEKFFNSNYNPMSANKYDSTTGERENTVGNLKQNKNGREMENVSNQLRGESTFDLAVKAAKRPRFKAGAELSGKVNLADIAIEETVNEESQNVELKMDFHCDDLDQILINLKTKRPKQCGLDSFNIEMDQNYDSEKYEVVFKLEAKKKSDCGC
jgi:hypothetical protein